MAENNARKRTLTKDPVIQSKKGRTLDSESSNESTTDSSRFNESVEAFNWHTGSGTENSDSDGETEYSDPDSETYDSDPDRGTDDGDSSTVCDSDTSDSVHGNATSDSEPEDLNVNAENIRTCSGNREIIESDSDPESDGGNAGHGANLNIDHGEVEDLNTNESEGENRDEIFINQSPLYQNAPISKDESAMAIILFSLRYSLSGEAISSLLQLISLHIPSPNELPKTLYFLRKIFKSSIGRTYIGYCPSCFTTVKEDAVLCSLCGNNFRHKTAKHFVQLSIKDQLQLMFSRKGFQEQLAHRFNINRDRNNLTDIYDGIIYRTLFVGREDPNSISFTWNTDGVPLFKSSSSSIWPIYLMINELPYPLRIKQENLILAGLWVDKKKPNMNTFFKSIYNDLNDLRQGVLLTPYGSHEQISVKGYLLCGTCDLPAKCAVLNMNQFNGRYGCSVCKQEGQIFRIVNDVNRGPRVYPFLELDVAGPKRNHDEFIRMGREAFDTGNVIYGVHGPSIMTRYVPDVINCTAFDVMHATYLGQARKLASLWFDSSFSTSKFSLSKDTDVINSRLLMLSVPHFVHRIPRSLNDIKYWKAAEFKYWLLYYSIPILNDLMKSEYLNHHVLLVSSIFLLNQTVVSNENINKAEHMLHQYCRDFEALYSLQHMTANLHSHLHAADFVRYLGPLWVFSCFPFETVNGKVLRLVHGTQYSQHQIVTSTSTIISLPMQMYILAKGSDISTYCEETCQVGRRVKKGCSINENTFVVGKLKNYSIVPLQVKVSLIQLHRELGEDISFFHRLKKGKYLYVSRSYPRPGKHKSYCVKYAVNGRVGYGDIYWMLRHKPCLCNLDSCICDFKYAIVLKPLQLSPMHVNNMRIPHIMVESNEGGRSYLCINTADLLSPCFSLYVASKRYISYPANDIDNE